MELADPDIIGSPQGNSALTRPHAKDVIPGRRIAQTAHEVTSVATDKRELVRLEPMRAT